MIKFTYVIEERCDAHWFKSLSKLMGGLAKGLPAIAGAKAIVSLYRDARGFIGRA
ncbi:hypothetical protein KUHS_13860 [Streptococcus salivarius]